MTMARLLILPRCNSWCAAALILGTTNATAQAAITDLGAPLGYKSTALIVEGVRAQIKITRDSNAVPTIEAKDQIDAAYGLGFVHAEDRLWPMEYQRRIASGTLAEIAGPALIESDRYYRTLGFRSVVERNHERLSTEARAVLDAYARGVNAWVAQAGERLPPEYRIFGFKPEPWTALDSLIIQKWFAFDLGKNWPTEMERLRITANLGSAHAFDLNPVNPDEPGATKPDLDALYAGILRKGNAQSAAIELPADFAVGSNNWAVSGARSGTGLPIVANDPHLPLSNSSPYYLVRQRVSVGSKGGQAWIAGASMPGIPVVRFGQTGQTAWAFTSMAPDSQDLFIERDTVGRPGYHDDPSGPLAFGTRREVIRVNGESERVIDVRFTPRGPILSDVVSSMKAVLEPGYAISVSWPGFADSDGTTEAAIAMVRATDWQAFRSALRSHDGPQLNIIYGDRAGTIAYRAAGSIPIRSSSHPTHGLAPAPAWLVESSWTGIIPFEEMHEEVNPERGWLATANHKTTPTGYPYMAFPDALPEYRYERIAALFQRAPLQGMAQHKQMQDDLYSDLDIRLRDAMLPLLGTEHAEIAQILRDWDGMMLGVRAEPLIISNWLRHFTRMLYADELNALFPSMWRLRSGFLFDVLSGRTSVDWCGNKAVSGPQDCPSLVRRAMAASLDELRANYGHDPASWRWDNAFRIEFAHPLLGKDDRWARHFNHSLPGQGGMVTLNVAYFPYTEQPIYSSVVGASYRAIYNLGDPTASLFVTTNGQSADPRSRHYNDLTSIWVSGSYLPLLGNGFISRSTILKPR